MSASRIRESGDSGPPVLRVYELGDSGPRGIENLPILPIQVIAVPLYLRISRVSQVIAVPLSRVCLD